MANKTAVVTGAGQGIGKAIAIALAKDGYDVVVDDVDQNSCGQVAREIKELGVDSLPVICDVTNKSQVENLFSSAVKKFGKVDVLVNNAGTYPCTPFMKIEESEWVKIIDVNLKSVFLCSQEAIKVMPEGGRIINISSRGAFVGFDDGLVHYCAAKAAIVGMNRALALELAPKITVNAVAPGAIDTPGTLKAGNNSARRSIDSIPLARFGTPEDIAGAVVFLASDKASYITGQTIIVDGGYTLR